MKRLREGALQGEGEREDKRHRKQIGERHPASTPRLIQKGCPLEPGPASVADAILAGVEGCQMSLIRRC